MSDDLGVEVDMFSTCHRCGVPISRDCLGLCGTNDNWTDLTGGDACGDDGVHEAMTLPQPNTPLVFVREHQISSAVRIRVGRHATFLYLNPNDSGEWYVSVPGLYGTLPRVVSVHPNTVEVAE